MRELHRKAIEKLADISLPDVAVSVTQEEAEFLYLDTWDTEEILDDERSVDGNS